LKNPEKPDDYLVRRLAATGGYEMASTDEKEESFVLKKDQCWVVSDNKKLKPKGINSLATAYIYIDISITFMLTFDGSLCTPVTI